MIFQHIFSNVGVVSFFPVYKQTNPEEKSNRIFPQNSLFNCSTERLHGSLAISRHVNFLTHILIEK